MAATTRAVCTGFAEAARRRCKAMAETYGLDQLPANIEARIQAARLAETPAQAQALAEKLVNAMEIQLLAAWSRGEIEGPDTPEVLERRAKGAEGLAKMMEKKEDLKGARRQLVRAAELRARIKETKS